MQDSEQLAQIAYEAAAIAAGGGSHHVHLRPRWDDLRYEQKIEWLAAAQAVKANVLGDFTKVGEGEQP